MSRASAASLDEESSRLILEHAGSVPHLEALLLLWESDPAAWTSAGLAARIYVPRADADRILRELEQHKLVVRNKADAFALSAEPAERAIVDRIAAVYRNNVAQVATMLHASGPKAIRDFSKAFRIVPGD